MAKKTGDNLQKYFLSGYTEMDGNEFLDELNWKMGLSVCVFLELWTC